MEHQVETYWIVELEAGLGSNTNAGARAFRVLSFVRWAELQGVSA